MYSECIPNVMVNSYSNTNLEGFGNSILVRELSYTTKHTKAKTTEPDHTHGTERYCITGIAIYIVYRLPMIAPK